MWLRGARRTDWEQIKKLYGEFHFDVNNLKYIVVVDDDKGNIIAAGSFITLLEGAFVADKSYSRKQRVEALKLVMNSANDMLKQTTYNSYHVFATNDSIVKILLRKFGFKEGGGKNLVKWLTDV